MSYEMPKRNETKHIYQIDSLYFVDVVEQVFLKVHSEVWNYFSHDRYIFFKLFYT